MLRAVVFDFDGVIVDSEPLHYEAIQRVTREHGVSFSYDDYLRDYIGSDDRDAFRLAMGGSPGTDAGLPAGFDLAGACARKHSAFEQILDEGINPIPGAVDLVHELSEQVPLAIASGAVRREIELILLRLGLTDRFAWIVAADDVARSKPDPQTYTLAVDALAKLRKENGIEPATTLAIEDTGAGIASARAAGLWTLGVTTTSPADRLADAHRVIESLQGVTAKQLHEWFA